MSPLASFVQSVLLGATMALCYDLLRPVRRRFPRLTGLADALWASGSALAVFLFLLRRTEGELRAFLLVGGAGGAVLFVCLCSPWLQPLWDFWAQVLAQFGRILALPLHWMKIFSAKSWKQAKNLFYFAQKCYTIDKQNLMVQSAEEGDPMRQRQQPPKKKKERVRSSFLTKVIILVLFAAVGFQLWRTSGQVAEATAKREELADEVARIEQENSALAEDISEGSTVEKMKEIARNELGYVDPGEYVFEIIGAG